MKLRRFGVVVVCVLLAAASAAAQSSAAKADDPISGQWGMNGLTFLDLKFDGEKAVSGTVVWRHDSDEQRSEIKSGSFDPKTNALKLEGETKLPGENTVAKYVIEGTLDKETLTGTFNLDKHSGQFTFTKLHPAQP
jgi:uncharacterized protein (DUF2147 family)